MKQKSLPTVVVSSFLIFYKPQHYFHQKQFYTQKSEKHKDSEINSLFNLGKKENFYGEGRKTGFERRVFFLPKHSKQPAAMIYTQIYLKYNKENLSIFV